MRFASRIDKVPPYLFVGISRKIAAKKADLRMSMFNADGSVGEMCGNGIRCLVRFALDRDIVPAGTSPVNVDTLAGILQVTPIWEGDVMTRARVSMGAPRLRPHEVPVNLPDQELVMDYPISVQGRDFQITSS